jgi:hypothetical protein
MKITTVVSQAILASSAVAAPFHLHTFKNRSSDIQTHKSGKFAPIITFITFKGFNKSSPQFPRETTATGLSFDSDPDNLKNFPTITTGSSDDRQKIKTNTTVLTHHHSRLTFKHIPKRDAAVATADGPVVSAKDLLDLFGSHDKNHTKLSDSQIEQALQSVQSLDATKFSDEAKAQRIIDQLQADLEMYRRQKFNSTEKQIDAIKDAEIQLRHLNVSEDSIVTHGQKLRDHWNYIDRKYHLKDLCSREAEEKKTAPSHLIYSNLFPSADNRHSWNRTASTSNKTSHFWSDLSKLWEKRALSQSSYGDLPGPQSTQDAYTAADQPMTTDDKLDRGREALHQVRAWLDDENKVYPTDDSLPDVFIKAWKMIKQYSLPTRMKKAYMNMVNEYQMSASRQPRYPQDNIGHIPSGMNVRAKLARRQQEPAWFKKFIFPEVENMLLHREDGVRWFDGGFTWENHENPKHDENRNEIGEPFTRFKNATDLADDVLKYLHSKNDNLKSSSTGKQNSSKEFVKHNFLADLLKPFEELKNATEHHFEHFHSKVRKLPSYRTEGWNSSTRHQKRDFLDDIAKPFEELKNTTEQAFEHFHPEVENLTSHAKHNTSKEYVKRTFADEVAELEDVIVEPWRELKNAPEHAFGHAHPKAGNLAHAVWKQISSSDYVKRDFPGGVRKLENKIGAEITKPWAALKNATEHDVDFLISKAKNLTGAASKKLNSSSTSEQSEYAKRDVPSNLKKLDNEIKNFTEHTIDFLASKVENFTSYTPEKLNQSSVGAQPIKQAAKRSNIHSIDGEEAYRRFHAQDSKSVKASKRQTTEEQAFSQEASSDAFERYITELEQEQDFQPPTLKSAAEQDKVRAQLLEIAQKSYGTATMNNSPTVN